MTSMMSDTQVKDVRVPEQLQRAMAAEAEAAREARAKVEITIIFFNIILIVNNIITKVLPVNSRGWTHTLANLTSNICWFLVTKTFQDLQVFVTISIPVIFIRPLKIEIHRSKVSPVIVIVIVIAVQLLF